MLNDPGWPAARDPFLAVALLIEIGNRDFMMARDDGRVALDAETAFEEIPRLRPAELDDRFDQLAQLRGLALPLSLDLPGNISGHLRSVFHLKNSL